MAQFSLSWDAYKHNICQGLSSLQQNGEFVDMTIAADGHLVKVHQMIMSLVSPYIKDLIVSANCPHPVIFLNKVSYPVLCAILEYIYTGEVMVDKDHLQDLIEAGRELHIKGLEDMKIELSTNPQSSQALLATRNEGQPLSETGFFDKPATETKDTSSAIMTVRKRKIQSTNDDMPDVSDFGDDHQNYDEPTESFDESVNDSAVVSKKSDGGKTLDTRIQYTVTNQGSLQMILNRYLYYLKYTSVKSELGAQRSWKCIFHQAKKTGCPAAVYTRDDVVIKSTNKYDSSVHDLEPRFDPVNSQPVHVFRGVQGQT